jgi:hypothetical protein
MFRCPSYHSPPLLLTLRFVELIDSIANHYGNNYTPRALLFLCALVLAGLSGAGRTGRTWMRRHVLNVQPSFLCCLAIRPPKSATLLKALVRILFFREKVADYSSIKRTQLQIVHHRYATYPRNAQLGHPSKLLNTDHPCMIHLFLHRT